MGTVLVGAMGNSNYFDVLEAGRFCFKAGLGWVFVSREDFIQDPGYVRTIEYQALGIMWHLYWRFYE